VRSGYGGLSWRAVAVLQRICVYCGSSPGREPAYADAAVRLGRMLARRGIGLVYGGGHVGLMGTVANAALDEGGEVIGVMPQALVDREIAHTGLTELRVVGSMHERKLVMAELADAFVALPGGMGTLEELFEVYTWTQLGLHAKPLALLNVHGYYDGLVAFLDHAVAERFVTPEHRAMLVVADTPGAVLEAFADWRAPDRPKWIDRTAA
jgi:uncharacterized protein (TIGR00730 family)